MNITDKMMKDAWDDYAIAQLANAALDNERKVARKDFNAKQKKYFSLFTARYFSPSTELSSKIKPT